MENMFRQDYSFRPGERMKMRKDIETLFQKGEAFSFFPFRVLYLLAEGKAASDFPVCLGISIPKKKIPKAYRRNLLKRRTREAWRLHKHTLYEHIPEGRQLHCFIIYTHKAILSSKEIEPVIRQIQSRLVSLVSIKQE